MLLIDDDQAEVMITDRFLKNGVSTDQDVDAAVKAARRAYEKTWSKMPVRERW